MNDEVEPPPPFAERLEDGVEAGVVHDVAGQDQVRADRLRERADALAQRLALIGERHLAAVRVHRLGDRPGDRAIVGDPHDQASLAGH